jgi:hypothetical protein
MMMCLGWNVMMGWLVKRWPLWVALVLASALYAQVFYADYAWDDWLLFVNRSVLRLARFGCGNLETNLARNYIFQAACLVVVRC